MKVARLLLAAVTVSLLAACGSSDITAPTPRGTAPAYDQGFLGSPG